MRQAPFGLIRLLDASPSLPLAGERDGPLRCRSRLLPKVAAMAEPVPQVVAQMPKAKLIGLLAAVSWAGRRHLHRVLHLSAAGDDAAVDFHRRERRRRPFRRPRQFPDPAHRRAVVPAVLERVQEQHDLLRHPHGGAESDRHRAGGPAEPARPEAEGLLPNGDLPADHAVGGHRRLLLEPDPVAALGRRRGRARRRSGSGRGSRPGSAWSRPRWSRCR